MGYSISATKVSLRFVLQCLIYGAVADDALLDRSQIWQIVASLHALKIAHGDIELRHFRLSPQTRKLCIIDFGRSKLDASSEALLEEKLYLAELLGYE